MKLVRIKAIAKKELIQVRRDPLSLAMAFALPALLLFLFGYAITLDVNNLTTVVRDLDRGGRSRDFIAELTASGYFTVVRYAVDDRELERLLDTGRARVAVSIPVNFSRDIRKGIPARVQVIVDGSDSNTATIALGYFAALVDRYGQKLGGAGKAPAIDSRVRVWYNPELKSRNFIIPGLVAVIMAIISALLTSLTFAREWERGTMEQLIATPVKGPELILGKLIPYFIIGFIDVALSVVISVLLFGVPIKGSLALLALVSSIFLFGGLGFGMLISIVTKSQLVSSQISMVATFLPAFLLSGFMFSISNMPRSLQIATHIIPPRYFVAALKAIFLKGSGPGLIAVELMVLLLFGGAVFAAANIKFVKRVS